MFDLQPTLIGDQIELRPLTSEDFAALYKAASDPLIWEQHPQNTRYQKTVFEGFFAEALKSQGALAVLDKKTREIIGTSRYYDLNLSKKEIAVGYTFLSRAYWGGTYNKELKTLMLNHAFQNIDTVYFHVGENNLRSQKALAKIGAHFYERREETSNDGSLKITVVFKITKT